MSLTAFIEEKIAIAKDFRNLDETNPVEIVVEDDFRNKFVILVSHYEPDAVTVPFNVAWINTDPNHKDFKVLQRRVDAESYDDGGYRYSWSVISSTEELFAELQYWKKDSDPILGELESFDLANASVEVQGVVRLTSQVENEEGEVQPIAISTTDPRMSDPREPKSHTHPQYPVSMFAAGNIVTQTNEGELVEPCIVYVANNDPEIGDILLVDSISPDGTTVQCRWGKLDNGVEYTGPKPEELTIIGPVETIDSLTNHVLRANVRLDDGTVFESVSPRWEVVTNNQFGMVGPNNGVFKALDVYEETVVRVKATWVHPESNLEISGFIDITIRDASGLVRLTRLEIEGPAQITRADITSYSVRAWFNDGTDSLVTPDNFELADPDSATLDGQVLTPSQEGRGERTVQLIATHTFGFVTQVATFNVKVIDQNVYVGHIEIVGPLSVNQSETANYTIKLIKTDGSSEDGSATSWSVTNGVEYATIDRFGALAAASQTAPGDRNVTIQARYTDADGYNYSSELEITIVDNLNYPEFARIVGPDSVVALTSTQYELEVTFTDGTVAKRPATSWRMVDSTYATIGITGTLNAKNVTEPRMVEIVATFTALGSTVTANKQVEVRMTDLRPIRYGVATFANKNFTGGVIEPLTEEQIMYGVSATESPNGTTYTKWANATEFFNSVMTNEIPSSGGVIEIEAGTDQYLYVAYEPRIASLAYRNLNNNFNITLNGVEWPDEIVVPPDPETPAVTTIEVEVDGEMQTWLIQRTDYPGPNSIRYQVTPTLAQ